MATKITKENLEELFVGKCWSVSLIARRFKVSREWVYTKIHEYELKRKCDLVREGVTNGKIK